MLNIKVLGALVACALIVAVPSLAHGGPVVGHPLAKGTMQATTINAQAGSMIFEKITIAPGGSFGWHTHAAPVAVAVAAGTLTVLRSDREQLRAVQGLEGRSRSSSPRTTCTSRATTARSPSRSTWSTSASRSTPARTQEQRSRRAATPELLAVVRDGDELVSLVAAALGLLEHGADAADVQLVIDGPRLERRRLLDEQGVLRTGSRGRCRRARAP